MRRVTALAAGLMAIAGVVAICAGVNSIGERSELMGEFDLYRPAINDLDLLSPSPLDYHTFDYERPDFAASMDMNLLSGTIGMPSYHFFKQQRGRASSQTLAAVPFHAGSAVVQQTASVDHRSTMENEERAESARCSGMLHACANWMALHTGKMRIITYGEGSWCTDDHVLGKACYEEDKEIAKDRLFDIPREGEPMETELWTTIQESCPILEGCPKPRGWSSTEEHSVYEAMPHILAEYQEARRALAQSCTSCISQRLRSQQSLGQLFRVK